MLRLICISMFFGSSASASDPATEFVGLWSDFLEFCGGVLVSPETAGPEAKPKNGYIYFSAARNAEGSDWFVEHHDEDSHKSLSFHLLYKQKGFELFCDAHRYDDLAFDPVAATRQIREMAEAGGLHVTGGAYVDLEGYEQAFAAERSAAQPHSLVVEGAFPGFDNAVHVNLDRNGMALSMYTSLRGSNP